MYLTYCTGKKRQKMKTAFNDWVNTEETDNDMEYMNEKENIMLSKARPFVIICNRTAPKMC